ncbi:MAG: hypothetical protein B7Z55_08595 [Planctomycetales bacterium 12-60-4]|nr:MAG: hypothetical protein B7Z55_08595 [Planctomycetales bacterium 12-60-4]
MTRLSVVCPECGETFPVKPERAGLKVGCKHCGAPVRVPDNRERPSTPKPQRRGEQRAPREVARSQSKSSISGLWLGLGIGGGVGVVGIVVVAVVLSGNRSNPPAPELVVSPPVVAPPVVPAPEPSPTAALTTSNAVADSAAPVVVPALAQATTPVNVKDTSETPATSSAPMASATPPAENTSAKLYDFPELISLVEPSVVRINVVTTDGVGNGSGFVVDDQGTIITNHHVMANVVRAEVEFVDGTKTPVVGFRWFHDRKDIAVIDIDLPPEKLRPIEVASELPKKGVTVMAFGAPRGLSFTSSDGIVSALRSEDEAKEQFDHEGRWVQTTAPISPGNSGGPLVDRFGRVVGMNSFYIEGQSLNFALSCVDIAEAMATAPSTIQPLKAGAIPDRSADSLTQQRAADEVGTERGQKLFAATKEIFVLNGLKTSSFDPTGAVWDRVIKRSEAVVEKTGLKISFGRPSPDAAVLIVVLDLRPSAKGTEGTQEMFIKSELLCVDPFAKKMQAVSRVWQAEEVVGTISLDALVQGQIPRTVDANVSKFFQSFRTAYLKAQRESKAAEEGETK